MLDKLKKAPKEVILLIIVVILALLCFAFNLNKNTENNLNENKNNETVENNNNDNRATYTEEIIDNNTKKVTSSSGLEWTEETNDKGEVIKTTYNDGTEYIEWEYYEDTFEETEEKTYDKVFNYRLMSEDELKKVAQEIKDTYEELKTADKDKNVDRFLEMYSKSIGLTLAVDDIKEDMYKIGQYGRDYVLIRFDGYKGLMEQDEIQSELETALNNILGQ